MASCYKSTGWDTGWNMLYTEGVWKREAYSRMDHRPTEHEVGGDIDHRSLATSSVPGSLSIQQMPYLALSVVLEVKPFWWPLPGKQQNAGFWHFPVGLFFECGRSNQLSPGQWLNHISNLITSCHAELHLAELANGQNFCEKNWEQLPPLRQGAALQLLPLWLKVSFSSTRISKSHFLVLGELKEQQGRLKYSNNNTEDNSNNDNESQKCLNIVVCGYSKQLISLCWYPFYYGNGRTELVQWVVTTAANVRHEQYVTHLNWWKQSESQVWTITSGAFGEPGLGSGPPWRPGCFRRSRGLWECCRTRWPPDACHRCLPPR